MICSICSKPLIGNYLVDIWDNKMCEVHFNKDAVHCDSCTAFTRKEHLLPDGRVLCKSCFDIAVKSGDSIEKIKTFVIKSLYQVGFSDLRIDDICSIEIVTAQRLAEFRKEQIDVQTKGFTYSTVITSTSFGVFGIKNTTQEFKHNIYILTHLTKTEFAGTLAHELLHAWLFQNGIKMSSKMTEGFCNMGTYLMYSSMPDEFSKMYLKSLHEDTDTIYGDGFREMFEDFERLGWKKLIEKVRNKGIVAKYTAKNKYSNVQKVIKFVKTVF